MKPPQEQIDRMLADGEFGVLVSIVCLGAALAVKRGGDATITDLQCDRPLPEKLKAAIRQASAERVEDFRRATPEQLDCAIALYTAHLKAAGYTYTAGQDN
jgi:hypothetical protein